VDNTIVTEEDVVKDNPLAKEQEIYFSIPETIKTIDGDPKKVKYPISWRKQENIVKIFASAVQKNPFPSNMTNIGEVVNFAVKTLGDVSGDVTAICAIILDESEDWVMDKLEFETVMEVVVPFVVKIFSTVNKTVLSGTKQKTGSKLVNAMRK